MRLEQISSGRGLAEFWRYNTQFVVRAASAQCSDERLAFPPESCARTKDELYFFSQWPQCACCAPATRGLVLPAPRCRVLPVQHNRQRPLPRASRVREAEMLPTLTEPLQDEKSMTTLTDEIKEFIVKGLARFDSPSRVAEAVKARFDIEVSRQLVHTYDPAGSQPPAPRWRELHAARARSFCAMWPRSASRRRRSASAGSIGCRAAPRRATISLWPPR